MVQWMLLLVSSNHTFVACDFQRTSALSEVKVIVWLSMYDNNTHIRSLGNFSIFQRQLRFLSRYMESLTDQPSLIVPINLCLV